MSAKKRSEIAKKAAAKRWGPKSLFEKSGMSVFSKQIAAHSDEDHGV
jgi:hypothetical protein